jgi:signal transduction histidine kinase
MLRRDLRAGTDPGDLAADGDALVTEARRLSDVMNDLLLSAQLGGDPRAGDLIDVARLANRVVAADRQRAAQRQITLSARTSPVPPVRGIAVALTRALTALVDNALHHAPVGGTVEVEVSPDGTDGVLLAVSDDGPGIESTGTDDLFARFARGENGRHGLGLSLVREVIQAHDGTVGVEAGDAGGARFVVRLPIAPQSLQSRDSSDDS